jgi:hypothetical protein
MIAESDDAWSPHLGLRTGRLLHDLRDGVAVLASLLVVDRVEEIGNTRRGRSGLELGHTWF